MGGAQAPRAYAGRGNRGPSCGQAHSGGSPSQCPQRPKKLVGREGGYDGGSTPCMPLDSDTLLWCLRLFPQTFLIVVPLAPVSSGCLFTAKSCTLPGSALETTLSSTQLPFATGDSEFRLECAELWCRSCVQFLLCLAFHRPSAVFSFDPPKFLFCPS